MPGPRDEIPQGPPREYTPRNPKVISRKVTDVKVVISDSEFIIEGSEGSEAFVEIIFITADGREIPLRLNY